MNNAKTKYKLICPECDAAVLFASPEAAIWERCPACRLHMWDMNDVLMAETIQEGTHFVPGKAGLGIQ